MSDSTANAAAAESSPTLAAVVRSVFSSGLLFSFFISEPAAFMKYIFFVLLVSLSACKPKHKGEIKPTLASHFLSISDNENNGIQEVLKVYGGKCEYGIAKPVSTGDNSGTAFWITLTNSESVENTKAKMDLILSNVAFLFCRNLVEEKEKYTNIKAKVIKSDGSEQEAAFAMSELGAAVKRFSLAQQIVSLLDKNDFTEIDRRLVFDSNFIPGDPSRRAEIIENFKKANLEVGTIKESFPYGFRSFETADGGEFYLFLLYVTRDKQSHPLSLVVKRDPNDDKIHYLNFKFP